MTRLLIIVLLLAAVVGGLLWWQSGFEWIASNPAPTATLYDTDADGEVDLIAWEIGDRGRLWRWDRDGDGAPEVEAYDVDAGPDGGTRPTGKITAWDYGADGVLDDGGVPESFERLLQEPPVAEALGGSPEGELALVGPEVNRLVRRIRRGYDGWRLSGFRMPIVGARLPDQDNLLPGAPRRYRNGTHQGFDMYPGHIGTPTGYGGPVVAANHGTVVRADHGYTEMTDEEHRELLATAREAGTTPSEILDRLRGRQVWIDHGHGVVTRYCHLSRIPEEIREGDPVEAGDVVGFVGNSGMEAGIRGSEDDAHLHFELRIDGRYLGQERTAEETRSRAREIFGLSENP